MTPLQERLNEVAEKLAGEYGEEIKFNDHSIGTYKRADYIRLSGCNAYHRETG